MLKQPVPMGLIGTALLAAACSCADSESVVTPPPLTGTPRSVAVAFGTITGPSGQPVQGAQVRIRAALLGQCEAGPFEGPFNTTTVASGAFGLDMIGPHTTWEACLEIRVTPPLEAGLRETVVVDPTVTFRLESETPPVDSVRVDVGLEAA